MIYRIWSWIRSYALTTRPFIQSRDALLTQMRRSSCNIEPFEPILLQIQRSTCTRLHLRTTFFSSTFSTYLQLTTSADCKSLTALHFFLFDFIRRMPEMKKKILRTNCEVLMMNAPRNCQVN